MVPAQTERYVKRSTIPALTAATKSSTWISGEELLRHEGLTKGTTDEVSKASGRAKTEGGSLTRTSLGRLAGRGNLGLRFERKS